MSDREAMELARDLVRGSIIEDAASRFISQVLKEAHDSRIKPLQDRIEELEAKLAASDTRTEIEAAVKRALEGAAEAVADYPRAAPDYDEWKLYDEQIEHAQRNIRALDPAQFVDGGE